MDAVNTSLEVLLFSACMNLGQSWQTVMIQFACEFSCHLGAFYDHSNMIHSTLDLLYPNMGRIPHSYPHPWPRLRTSRRHPHAGSHLRIHRNERRRKLLAPIYALLHRHLEKRPHPRLCLQHAMDRLVYCVRWHHDRFQHRLKRPARHEGPPCTGSTCSRRAPRPPTFLRYMDAHHRIPLPPT